MVLVKIKWNNTQLRIFFAIKEIQRLSRMEGFRLPVPSQIHASINPFLMDLHVYFDMCLNLWFHILYLHLL